MVIWPDLVVNSSFAGPNICFGRLMEWLPLEYFPADVEDEENRNVDVCDDEVLHLETTNE
jgi:hypothetical protein